MKIRLAPAAYPEATSSSQCHLCKSVKEHGHLDPDNLNGIARNAGKVSRVTRGPVSCADNFKRKGPWIEATSGGIAVLVGLGTTA
eukprot:CAMPEP_0206498026 /NCGR_PEP_ID=MMETSP0324_2-20121206/50660_1 /ASSEMBLY_ACC=CAM_ASM_000836 /TAXON_ID=2866 /ORGANISM="Crypthecodinium cohnii, Strain Seligo" /LENGTH=84 /DNA_ID=CAMNT_0053983957 /DNA_START=43 /DNA_END=295 /DNA_ORIENTATION=-